MDAEEYFKGILEKLDNMTDEEFEQLMIDSGIEDMVDNE